MVEGVQQGPVLVGTFFSVSGYIGFGSSAPERVQGHSRHRGA